MFNLNRTNMKTITKDLQLNGSLKEKLLNGSKIIWSKFDGFDFHIIIENPKGSEWRYEVHQTLNDIIGKNEFSLMKSYNWDRRSVIKEVVKEFYEDMFHKEEKRKRKASS